MNSLGRERFKIADTISAASSSAQGTFGRQASRAPSHRGVGASPTPAGSRAYSRAGLWAARISWLFGKNQTTPRNKSTRLVALERLRSRPAVEKENPCNPVIAPSIFKALEKFSARKNTQAATTARDVATRPGHTPTEEDARAGCPLRSLQARQP